jgi:hypothetical protein
VAGRTRWSLTAPRGPWHEDHVRAHAPAGGAPEKVERWLWPNTVKIHDVDVKA